MVTGGGGDRIRLIRTRVLRVTAEMGTARLLSASASRRRRFEIVSGDSDDILLTRIAGGDREAFASLFQRYAGRIKSYLLRLGAPGGLAEDLAQDVMVSAWRRAASFDPARAKASTWMFVIARNAWIDKLRREKVELAYRDKNGMADVSQDEAPDLAAARTEEEEKVSAILATLSPEQRKVVQLSFYEDRPHSEIAERLSIPLGTVKSRLRLALLKLRGAWEQAQ